MPMGLALCPPPTSMKIIVHFVSFLMRLLFFFFKQKTAYEIGLGIPAEPLFRSEAVKILIFAAEGLTKRSAVGFLLRSLSMFQTFISRHNSNFFSDKLVLTSVTPASSAPVLQRSEERRVGKECRCRWS